MKQKRASAAPAGDLYTSTLFTGLRRYAERVADRWFILSAKHGVLEPSAVTEPYELTLNTMAKKDRLEWAGRVQQQLDKVLAPGCEVVLLAGARYREGVEPYLRAKGHPVSIPLEGLPLGKQLQWLSQNA